MHEMCIAICLVIVLDCLFNPLNLKTQKTHLHKLSNKTSTYKINILLPVDLDMYS